MYETSPIFLKGPGSQIKICLKAYKIESILYVYAPLVLKFLGCLVKGTNEKKYFDCFYETLTNNFCIGYPLFYWLIFSLVCTNKITKLQ
jgi:hypothetical protein